MGKGGSQTATELENVMVNFMTNLQSVTMRKQMKYMDVVNETILPSGKWFGPKKVRTCGKSMVKNGSG